MQWFSIPVHILKQTGIGLSRINGDLPDRNHILFFVQAYFKRGFAVTVVRKTGRNVVPFFPFCIRQKIIRNIRSHISHHTDLCRKQRR